MSMFWTTMGLLLFGIVGGFFCYREKSEFLERRRVVEKECRKLGGELDTLSLEYEDLVRQQRVLERKADMLARRERKIQKEIQTLDEKRNARNPVQWLLNSGHITEKHLAKAKSYIEGTSCPLPLEDVLVMLDMISPGVMRLAKQAVSSSG
ncbi:hypothetical protein [Desulfobaculum bizertense]|uniref:Uncharacterized protein n=1 Tax=Desulfobaculum bizertense DSM 18034 TaxID=1121442 RepID=A0A1T4VI24_9BACT|nr:hypothetical protein [Desulfobaculum bizertense]UIJ37887.1 hypothetical protein LWC08_14510 [Desulfobaculum bizertense]SKA64594.1 hypothetical protein SAMN02745702_00363 [Desulfobaculum bizertense DSM 18034]